MQNLSDVINTIQTNCHIADARHAQGYTMCTYLMKLREYYRWEHHHLFSDSLPKDALGNWITERENTWESVIDQDYRAIPINDTHLTPFEPDAINQALKSHGYVYSAGYGRGNRPHFFLGELNQQVKEAGFTVYYVGKELARDLSSPPAMLQNNQLFIRQESYQRLVWERIEEWRWLKHKQETALGRALQMFAYQDDPVVALKSLADSTLPLLLWHEMGEWTASQTIGPQWLETLQQLNPKHENLARSAKDLWADCLSTLPHIIKQQAEPALHFYLSQHQTTRKALFPKLISAYQQWQEKQQWAVLEAVVEEGSNHFEQLCQQLLEQYQRDQRTEDVQAFITQAAL